MNEIYKTLSTCPPSAKNVGDNVILTANITQGVPPYTIKYKKDLIELLNGTQIQPSNGIYTYSYILTPTDIGGHSFSVDVYDSCMPTLQYFTDQCMVTVNSPCPTPSCDFTWTPVNPVTNELITFTASDTTLTTHIWKVDGIQQGAATSSSIIINFNTPGSYVIRHEGMNNCGSQGISVEKTVTISEPVKALVKIEPSTQSIINGTPFSLDVTIDPQGIAITAYQFNLTFNPAIISISNVIQGNLLNRAGATFFMKGTIDNITGTLINTLCMMLGAYSVNTKGVAATIQFNALAAGTSNITLSNVIVSDPASKAVLNLITDGSITVTDPCPTPLCNYIMSL